MHYHCWFVLNPVLSSCSNLFYFWPQWIAYAEKAMAPHSNILDWKIPWTEEPGGLQSMGLRRVGHDWVTSLSLFSFMHWKRKWQHIPVFLPGKSHEQRSLAGYCPWGHKSWMWLSDWTIGTLFLINDSCHDLLYCRVSPDFLSYFTKLALNFKLNLGLLGQQLYVPFKYRFPSPYLTFLHSYFIA